MGVQWSFYNGDGGAIWPVIATRRQRWCSRRRARARPTARRSGSSTAITPTRWRVEIDADPGATAGLLLFYSRRLYAGLGFSAKNLIMHSYGLDRPRRQAGALGRRLHIRLRNDRHIVTMHYSVDGKTWERFDRGIEVSGYHHNVAYDFLSLRPALYAAGSGEVRFRNFKYRALQ